VRFIRLPTLDLGVFSGITRFFWALCVFSSLAFAQGSPFGFVPNSGIFPPAIRFVRYSTFNFFYITRDSFVLYNGARVQIANINTNAQPVGGSPTGTLYNSYVGKTASQWITNAPMYGAVELNNVYPGVSAMFTTSLVAENVASIGQGEVIFSIAAGADPSSIQLNVLNAGSGMPGPGTIPDSVWFGGTNTVPGVFAVAAQATQTAGGVSTPVTCNLLLNSSNNSLSIQLPDRKDSLPTVVTITFPDYDDVTPQSQLSAGLFASYVNYPITFGQDGALTNTNCFDFCTKSFAASIGADGKPVWVTLFGGSSGNDQAQFSTPSQNGVSVSGITGSTDFPVTASAPYSTLASSTDLYLAYFDGASGHLLDATYAGLQGTPSLYQQIANAAGDVAICGGYSVSSGLVGYILLWQPPENQFVYRFRSDAPVVSLAFDGSSNLFFASRQGSTASGALGVGELDASGNLVGSTVAIDLPQGTQASEIQLQPAAGSGFWIVYQLAQSDAADAALPDVRVAFISPALGQTPANSQVAAHGFLLDVGITPAGNLKLLVQYPIPTEATTPDAPLVAECSNNWYFAILSPAGQLVYATYVPGTQFGAPNTAFNFSTQNESTGPPPAVISCFASTASRFPSGDAAPGQLITLTGGGFGPLTTVSTVPGADGTYPLAAAGFSVKIGGLGAPVFAVSRGLITVQVPYEIASLPASKAGTALTVEVYQNGQAFQSMPLTETNVNLNLFDTGDRNNALGLPALAALNEDGTVNSFSHPAAPGSVVTLFGSGAGILSPPLKTGALSPVPPAGQLSVSSATASCSGGCDGILYLGSAPGLSTAVTQIAMRIPAGASGVIQPDGIGIWLNLMPGYPPPPPTGVVFIGERPRRRAASR
jgi:uncharacterized protein (TIGR03437 family)